MNKIVGKVAVITGAGGGLGKYIALRFAEEAAKLALCDINAEGLNETTELCKSKGADVFAKHLMLLILNSQQHLFRIRLHNIKL